MTLNKKTPPTNEEFLLLIAKIDFNIDKDFIEFIKASNGAEGLIAQDFYLQIWKANEILELNPYYEDVPKCRELFFFGSNGGDIGYAFDKKNGNIVAIGWLDISYEEPQIISYRWNDFINGKMI